MNKTIIILLVFLILTLLYSACLDNNNDLDAINSMKNDWIELNINDYNYKYTTTGLLPFSSYEVTITNYSVSKVCIYASSTSTTCTESTDSSTLSSYKTIDELFTSFSTEINDNSECDITIDYNDTYFFISSLYFSCDEEGWGYTISDFETLAD
ncbi:MAG: DUF6174 domain-containing protein [Pseudomonadota bacterium]